MHYHKSLFACGLGLALALTGCAGNQTQTNAAYLTQEAAQAVALSDAGVSTKQAVFHKIQMNQEGKVHYYEVDFRVGEDAYQYDIDALTGLIIDSQRPTTIASTTNDTMLDTAALGQTESATPAPTQSVPQPATAPTQQASAQTKSTAAPVQTPDPVQVPAVVTPAPAAQTPAVSTNDAMTSATVSGPAPAGTISIEEARSIALAKVPGATDVYIKTDYDDGRYEYEGKIYYQGMEYEFEIDAYSGAIRDWDVESMYD